VDVESRIAGETGPDPGLCVYVPGVALENALDLGEPGRVVVGRSIGVCHCRKGLAHGRCLGACTEFVKKEACLGCYPCGQQEHKYQEEENTSRFFVHDSEVHYHVAAGFIPALGPEAGIYPAATKKSLKSLPPRAYMHEKTLISK